MEYTQTYTTPVVETITLTFTDAEAKAVADMLVNATLLNVDHYDLRWNLVDAINAARSGVQSTPPWHIAAADKIAAGARIAAIKEVRTGTGWGLKQAKDYVDEHWPSVTPQDARY